MAEGIDDAASGIKAVDGKADYSSTLITYPTSSFRYHGSPDHKQFIDH